MVQLIRVISIQKVGELKSRMREQAYLGWLIYLLQPLATKSKRMNLQEWLKGLNLIGEKEKDEKPENVEEMRKKSLEIARKIVAIHKKVRS